MAETGNQLLPYLMFSIRESARRHPQFELLYGRQPRGLLDMAKEAWEEQASPHGSLVEHVEEMQSCMKLLWPMVREHKSQAQEAQRPVYNRDAQPREFQPGDTVLVLVPTTDHTFLASWQGPYEVAEKVGSKIGRWKPIQIYHVKLLKKWFTREAVVCCASPCAFPSSSPDGADVEVWIDWCFFR